MFWTVLGSLFGALWGRLRAVFGCKGRFEGSFWVDFGYVLSFFRKLRDALGFSCASFGTAWVAWRVRTPGALDPKAYGSFQGFLGKRCWRLSSYNSVFFFLRRYWGRKEFSVPNGAGFVWTHFVMAHFRACSCDNL